MANGVNRKQWAAVRIPKGLLEEIEKYLKTKEAEKRGFTSASGFAEHAIRKELGLA